MKKILRLIIVIIFSAGVGVGIFSFVIAKNLYFPSIKEIANDSGAGLHLNAYQYDPWLWNKEKITIVSIHDRKNDAPNTQYKLKGEIYNLRLIHSGEDFALIAYSDSNLSLRENGYVVHRSPKAEGENTIEEIQIDGNIIAVAPDESGYFYISGEKIFKNNWQGETIISANLEMSLEPILGIQQIGVSRRLSYQPILFFNNNTKLAFWGTPLGERDSYLFIWDLDDNKINKIFRQDIGNYHNLVVEDDELYMERTEVVIFKKLIVE